MIEYVQSSLQSTEGKWVVVYQLLSKLAAVGTGSQAGTAAQRHRVHNDNARYYYILYIRDFNE